MDSTGREGRERDRAQPHHGTHGTCARGTNASLGSRGKRRCLRLTEQLDVLLADTQRVGDLARGSCPQQVVVHAHRQVAGDVLIFNVLMSL